MHITFICPLSPHHTNKGSVPAVRGSSAIKIQYCLDLYVSIKPDMGLHVMKHRQIFFCLHFEKSRDIIDTHHFLFSTLLGFLVFASPASVAVGYLLIRNSVIEVTSFS